MRILEAKTKKEFARLRRVAAPKARHRHANALSLNSYTDTCTYLRGALMVNFEALKKKHAAAPLDLGSFIVHIRGCAAALNTRLRRGLKHAAAPRPSGRTERGCAAATKSGYIRGFL